MIRTALILGCSALLIAATGCTMCCHPYDQSGPVFSEDGTSSSMHSRVGSILGGSSQSSSLGATPRPAALPADSQMQDKSPSPTPTPAPPQARKQRQPIPYAKKSGGVEGQKRPSISYAKDAGRAERPKRPSVSFAKDAGRTDGPTLGSAQPGDVAGSERIVSVTDRVVNSSGDASPAADEPVPQSSKALPATGWSARRPTGEVLR
jgi:hypothetical protein